MKKHHKEERIWCFRRWSRKPWAAFAALRRLKIGVLSVAMSIILLATNIAGAQTAGTDSLVQYRTLHLDTVQVRAARTAAVTHTILSQSALYVGQKEAAPLQTAESVLRLLPSADVRERGGKGVQADISIRGGSFDQTMVMLNGVNFSDARTGHQSHALPVDIDCISDIAVLDGTSAVGALAGAVDFRTKPQFYRYLRANLSGGTWGYAYGNLSGAWTHDRLMVFGAASYRRSDGYRYNTDFANINAYARITYDSRAGLFDIQGGFQKRDWGSNGFYSLKFPDQFEATETGLTSVVWRKDWRNFTLGASANYRKNIDRFEMQRGDPSTIPFNYHNTDNAGAGLWGEYGWQWGVTTLRADWTFNNILSTALGEPLTSPSHRIPGTDALYTRSKERHTLNVWLGHVKRWDKFDAEIQGGVVSTPYGTSGTWQAGAGWRPAMGFSLYASANSSMRLPTFTDLYYSVTGYHPDPSLVPEKATTFRLEADYFNLKGFRATAGVYYRRTRDVIDWEQHEDGNWYSTQMNRLGTVGAELSVRYAPDRKWLRLASLSYGYIHSDMSVATDYISKYALDYLRHKVSAVVGITFLRNFAFTLTGSLCDRMGSYIAADGAKHGYEPYFLLDGRLSWECRWLQLYVDTTNMTNTRYFDFGGLPMPGIWASAGVVITIK